LGGDAGLEISLENKSINATSKITLPSTNRKIAGLKKVYQKKIWITNSPQIEKKSDGNAG